MMSSGRIFKQVARWVYSQRSPKSSISNKEILDRLEYAIVSKQLFLQPAITQKQISLIIGINRTYVNRAIKSMNSTFRDYLNSFRIQYAMKLLLNKPNYSCYEVAELSGFGTLKTMDVSLRKTIGTTSSNIRKRYLAMKQV